MHRLLILLFFIGMGCSAAESPPNKVLLISFDGFRHDYLDKTDTPNFDQLVKDGVISDGLIPIFPSNTFPNYYALATGLYPENNGFIDNSMYDSTIGTWFSMGNREQVENPAWYLGEPIWNTAEKQGVRAGTMFWVGSEAPIQNMRPTHWKRYDGSMPNQDRIDSVLKWMTLGTEKEVDFGTLYFSFVDDAGHRFGPESEEVIQAIKQADELIGYLQQRIAELGLTDQINKILVADHGMAQLSRDRIVYIDDFIETENLDVVSWGDNFMMNGDMETIDHVYNQLKQNETNFRVFKKEDLPERFRVKNSPRFPDLIAIADVGYLISTRDHVESRQNYATGGTHGFDNQAKEMHGLLLMHGPDFKKGEQIPEIENVHIYELIAHLLNIDSAGTDGDINAIKSVLK
ncbi:MAG: alkaline phosphatase family protein [Balneolaceae bacterium]|nr:alkaline phosphatase family protein [Balneolaceae bacterium]